MIKCVKTGKFISVLSFVCYALASSFHGTVSGLLFCKINDIENGTNDLLTLSSYNINTDNIQIYI